MNPEPQPHYEPPGSRTPHLALVQGDRDADEALVETIAARVLDLLTQRGDLVAMPSFHGDHRLLTASEVALRYRVHRNWVYANARRLGAIRLGDGPKAALRFDPSTVADAISALRAPRLRHAPQAAEPRATDKPKRGLLPVRDW